MLLSLFYYFKRKQKILILILKMETRASKKLKLAQNETMKLLKDKCTSVNNTDSSTDSPFYNIVGNRTIQDELYTQKVNLEKQYVEFMNNHNFDTKLKLIYLVTNNKDSEIQFNGFNFFKLTKIINDQYIYKNFIDIGVHYQGMGHVIMLSVVKNTGELFFREDGGSNGYEAEIHWKFFQNFNPLLKHKNNMLPYKEVINIITSGKLNEPYYANNKWFDEKVISSS